MSLPGLKKSLGNRANILADYDQKENMHGDYLIYRLF